LKEFKKEILKQRWMHQFTFSEGDRLTVGDVLQNIKRSQEESPETVLPQVTKMLQTIYNSDRAYDEDNVPANQREKVIVFAYDHETHQGSYGYTIYHVDPEKLSNDDDSSEDDSSSDSDSESEDDEETKVIFHPWTRELKRQHYMTAVSRWLKKEKKFQVVSNLEKWEAMHVKCLRADSHEEVDNAWEAIVESHKEGNYFRTVPARGSSRSPYGSSNIEQMVISSKGEISSKRFWWMPSLDFSDNDAILDGSHPMNIRARIFEQIRTDMYSNPY